MLGFWDESVSKWPEHCKGTINAWLLIVGPSPGDSPTGVPTPDQMHDYQPLIGCPHLGFYYPDKRHYWEKVRGLAENFFSEFKLNSNAALSMMFHVDISAESSGKQLSKEKLLSDAPRTEIIFRTTRPKCIIPLTQRVFDILREFYKPCVLKSGELFYGRYHPEWELWDWGCSGRVLVARTPNHPSRHGYWLLPKFAHDLAKIAKQELDLSLKEVSYVKGELVNSL